MIKKILNVAALFLCISAQAAEVSISKLRVNLEKGQNADFIVLQNKSEKDKQSYSVSLQKWTQEEVKTLGGDVVNYFPKTVLTDTKEMSISPKTLIIPPNGEKVVRIIVNNREKADEDYSYRLLITQLPDKNVKNEVNTISLLFKVSMPIFVLQEKIKKADNFNLSKEIVIEGDKKFLLLKNNDNQHIQVKGMGKDKESVGKNSISVYLLPKISTKIEIPAELATLPSFVVDTDKGFVEVKAN